jgi:UDP-glucose 4-epimerase
MRYLITGIAGFVGSSLARSILVENPDARITGIDNLSFGYRDRIADLTDRIEFIEGDLIDIDQLLGRRHFDSIIHCAAIASLPENQRDSHRSICQNVSICGAVTDYALSSGSRDIIFFSSAAIYEGTTEFPTNEDAAISTSLVYPTTKYLAEQYFKAMCASHRLNVTALRLFNLYGPHQDYFRKQPSLMAYLLLCLVRKQQAVLFSSGEQSRDYIYIDDLLALVKIIAYKMKDSATSGQFTAVNAGSGIPTSVNKIIDILETISGEQLKIERRPAEDYWNKYKELFARPIALDRAAVNREVNKHSQADIVKAHYDYGWKAKISMEYGLNACLLHCIAKHRNS